MESGNYNKISGKKTLLLVASLIAAILFLSIYSVILVVRKSAVITNSIKSEKPTPTTAVKKPRATPTLFVKPRYGD